MNPNYLSHQNPYVKGQCTDLNIEQYKELIDSFHQAFPNAQVRIFDQASEGNTIATRWEIQATQTTPFQGRMPSSKKTTAWSGMSFDCFNDDQIIEIWVSWDIYTFLSELGHLKMEERIPNKQPTTTTVD